MRKAIAALFVAGIWMYGSEAVDSLIADQVYRQFMRELQCWHVDNTVYCRLGRVVYGSDGSSL